MDLVLYITTYSTLLLGTKSLAAINCPDVSIPKGSSRVISCDSHPSIIDFYWYRGETSESSPILTLDGGQKGGSEFGQEHFDIGDNGSMIISDVKLEHESYYTFVGYYDRENYESVTFMVNITISPNTLCPVIDGCIPCTKCVILHPEEAGSFKCSISGARPKIPLKWNITSQSGISFVKYQPVEQRNKATDSWDTSVLVDYKLTTPCGARANIYCTGRDDAKIISSPVAVVEISNDPCTHIISTRAPTALMDVDEMSRKSFIVILSIVVPTVIVSTVIVIFLVYCLVRRKTEEESGENTKDPEGMPMLPMQPVKDKKALHIISLLEENYKKYCYVKPLPWGEEVPINALYTTCQCTVTSRDGKTLNVSSEELLRAEYIKNEKRVIFIGDLGFGKTTFTKQVVNNWIEKKKGKYLLVYILLKDVTRDMKLSEIVMKHLPNLPNGNNADEVIGIISQYGCLVLLDGLDELSMTAKDENDKAKGKNYSETAQSAKGEVAISSITLQQILNGDVKLMDVNINIWVTSREIDYAKKGFPTPYVKVKMNGFSREQADDYIEKTCRYYCPPNVDTSGGKSGGKLADAAGNPMLCTNTTVDESITDKETTRDDKDKIEKINVEKYVQEKSGKEGTQTQVTNKKKIDEYKTLEEWEKVASKVKQFLERNDVLSSFEKTPLLFIMMVHIMSAKHTSAISELNNVTIDKLTTLISTVISCLVSRYVQKRNMSLSNEITLLETILGETALKHNVQITVMERDFWVKEIGEQNVKMALEIGLLRLSTNTASSSKRIRNLAFSSFTGIEFYNELFQAYVAANFVIKNQSNMQHFIKSVGGTKEHQTFRVLQFVCGLNGSVIENVCKTLQSLKKYNNLIDCLCEGNDQETFKKVVERLAGDALNISYLDGSYHKNSLSTFCRKCNELGIKLHSVQFHSDCTIPYLTTLRLPELHNLHFFGAVLSELDFLSFLKWLPTQKINGRVRFIQCKIPEQISNEHLLEVRKENQTDVEVCRKKKNDVTVSIFDYQSGTWKWIVRRKFLKSSAQ